MLTSNLISKYAKKKLKLASAESCTGGAFAKAITDLSGASGVFTFSAVTYSNEAKMKLLGVNKDTIKQFGAVSKETVSEMLDGVLGKNISDIAIAVSGIAGPNSDETNKEVGLVYIGIADNKNKKIVKFQFKDKEDIGRKEIRKKSVLEMLKLAIEFI